MSNQAFVNGFLKEAMATGLNEYQAANLYKRADGAGLMEGLKGLGDQAGDLFKQHPGMAAGAGALGGAAIGGIGGGLTGGGSGAFQGALTGAGLGGAAGYGMAGGFGGGQPQQPNGGGVSPMPQPLPGGHSGMPPHFLKSLQDYIMHSGAGAAGAAGIEQAPQPQGGHQWGPQMGQ